MEDPVAKAIELSKFPKIEDELTERIDELAINDYFNDGIVQRPTAVDKRVLNQAVIIRINKNKLGI